MNEPLAIALVGHSNVGKTSLVAALSRDADLQIAEEAGTTRVADRREFRLDGQPLLVFLDTPGFEEASRIGKWLDAVEGDLDGPARVEAFLADEATHVRFSAEKEALRAAGGADVLAYVADVSQPPSGQQRHELRLLRRTGVPMIAVLNVLDDADRRAEWTDTLRREGIDTIVPLDAHAFPAQQEADFYAALGLLRPEHRGRLESVAQLRQRRAVGLRRGSARVIAELLVDGLSFTLGESAASKEAAETRRKPLNDRFQAMLRERERRAWLQLLELHGFDRLQLDEQKLVVESFSGAWQDDLFDPSALRRYGVSAGTLAVVGAIGGSLLDAVGGLGAGTVIGGLAGAAAGVAVGRRVSTTVHAGGVEVGPVDAVQFPSVLLHRAVEVYGQVEARSHARNTGAVGVSEGGTARLGATGVARLNGLARRIRRKPAWSGVQGPPPADADRARVVDELLELVHELLQEPR
jgi:GTPase SAR1 family protein